MSAQTLKRFPLYLDFLKKIDLTNQKNISSKAIANAINLGEVQVRKDLQHLSCIGKKKTGYDISELINALQNALTCNANNKAVVVGVGKLGQALMSYMGFSEFGLEIVAGFDNDEFKIGKKVLDKIIYSISDLKDYVEQNQIKIVIITVPKEEAQQIANWLKGSCVQAYLNFAPINLIVDKNIIVRNENIATSLLQLSKQIKTF